MRLNGPQRKFWAERTGRDVILKARQFGFSTQIEINLLDECLFMPNTIACILAHRREAIERLFETVRFAYNKLPEELRVPARRDTKHELKFDNGSHIYVALEVRAGTIHFLHISEAAFIEKEERIHATLEAVVPGGSVTVESTPRALGGWFYDVYQGGKRGMAEFRSHFFPWFIFQEYRSNAAFMEPAELTEEETSLGLDSQQAAWRRAKIKKLGFDVFRREYPEDDESCFLFAGHQAFDATCLRQMVSLAKETEPEYGNIINTEWEATRSGLWARFEPPEHGEGYVIGADAAEGLYGHDFSAAVVVSTHRPRIVARLNAHLDPNAFAEELYKGSCHYNRALVCPERNNHGLHVVALLCDRRVPLYRYRTQDRVSLRVSDKYGWLTTKVTKPQLVDDVKAVIVDGSVGIPDMLVLKQMLSYMEHDDHTYSAPPGKFDDLVMAFGLALQALQTKPSRPHVEKLKYPEPMVAKTGY